jgi:hypothetical protein
MGVCRVAFQQVRLTIDEPYRENKFLPGDKLNMPLGVTEVSWFVFA